MHIPIEPIIIEIAFGMYGYFLHKINFAVYEPLIHHRAQQKDEPGLRARRRQINMRAPYGLKRKSWL